MASPSEILRPWTVADIGDQRGKTVIITGANSGIGFYVAQYLGLAGAKVILACRSEKKGLEAIQKLRAIVSAARPVVGNGSAINYTSSAKTHQKIYRKHCTAADSNNDSLNSTTQQKFESDENCSGHFELKLLDLSSLKDVVRFAADFNKEGRPLDILVNNAGIMMPPYARSVDGFESQFAANYIGHFVLTEKLMPSLLRRRSSAAADGSSSSSFSIPRVVCVSSIIAWRALQYKVIDFVKDGVNIVPPPPMMMASSSGGDGLLESYERNNNNKIAAISSSISSTGSNFGGGSVSVVNGPSTAPYQSLHGGSPSNNNCCNSLNNTAAKMLNVANSILTHSGACSPPQDKRNPLSSTRAKSGPAFKSTSIFGGSSAGNNSSSPSVYDRSEVYAETKLAALLFMKALSRRYDGTTTLCSVAAHPGVSSSNLHQHRFGDLLWAMQSPESGALPIVRACVDPKARSGDYFAPRGFGYAGYPNAGILPPAANDAVYCEKFYDATVAAVAPILKRLAADEEAVLGEEAVGDKNVPPPSRASVLSPHPLIMSRM